MEAVAAAPQEDASSSSQPVVVKAAKQLTRSASTSIVTNAMQKFSTSDSNGFFVYEDALVFRMMGGITPPFGFTLPIPQFHVCQAIRSFVGSRALIVGYRCNQGGTYMVISLYERINTPNAPIPHKLTTIEIRVPANYVQSSQGLWHPRIAANDDATIVAVSDGFFLYLFEWPSLSSTSTALQDFKVAMESAYTNDSTYLTNNAGARRYVRMMQDPTRKYVEYPIAILKNNATGELALLTAYSDTQQPMSYGRYVGYPRVYLDLRYAMNPEAPQALLLQTSTQRPMIVAEPLILNSKSPALNLFTAITNAYGPKVLMVIQPVGMVEKITSIDLSPNNWSTLDILQTETEIADRKVHSMYVSGLYLYATTSTENSCSFLIVNILGTNSMYTFLNSKQPFAISTSEVAARNVRAIFTSSLGRCIYISAIRSNSGYQSEGKMLVYSFKSSGVPTMHVPATSFEGFQTRGALIGGIEL